MRLDSPSPSRNSGTRYSANGHTHASKRCHKLTVVHTMGSAMESMQQAMERALRSTLSRIPSTCHFQLRSWGTGSAVAACICPHAYTHAHTHVYTHGYTHVNEHVYTHGYTRTVCICPLTAHRSDGPTRPACLRYTLCSAGSHRLGHRPSPMACPINGYSHVDGPPRRTCLPYVHTHF